MAGEQWYVQNTTRCRVASLPLVLTAHTRALSLSLCPPSPHPPPSRFYMASGQVHGPFDLDRMRAWYQHGFFEDDLDVSRGARNNFQKLRMFQEITSVGKIGATPERAAPVASGAAAASVRVNRHGSISIGGGGAAATAAEAAQQPLFATPQRSANAAAATAWTPQQVAAAMKPMAAQAGVAQQQQQAQSQSLRSSGADPSASYFYTVAGTEYGPFSRRQLQAWATAGYFTEDYAVRAAAGGASGVLSDIANMPQDTKPAVGGDRPGMPMVVDAFEKAIESLGPQNDGGLQGATSTDLVATGNDA